MFNVVKMTRHRCVSKNTEDPGPAGHRPLRVGLTHLRGFRVWTPTSLLPGSGYGTFEVSCDLLIGSNPLFPLDF